MVVATSWIKRSESSAAVVAFNLCLRSVVTSIGWVVVSAFTLAIFSVLVANWFVPLSSNWIFSSLADGISFVTVDKRFVDGWLVVIDWVVEDSLKLCNKNF